MARNVTHTRKATDGTILGLGNPQEWWSVRLKQNAVQDIDGGLVEYVVPWRDGSTHVRVVNGPTGAYLRTDRDHTTRNNLLDLPNI